MKNWQRYPEYKDSGVEWLGEIPKHWQVKKVKWITVRHKQGYYTEQKYVDSGVKLARITDIDDFANVKFDEMPYVVISSKEEENFKISSGDFLFARSGTIGRFGLVRHAERSVFASYLIQFKFKNVNVEYLRYVFMSHFFKENLISTLHGGANQNIHAENIKSRIIIFPPLSEQKAIAHFLDRETSKLDKLIAKKQRFIELLQEKRTALISHAVTKGLNPDIPMKDSGISWLGQIPKHWEVKQFRHCAKIANGQVDPRLQPYRSMILIAPNHIESGTGRILYKETADEQGADSGKYIYQKENILYSKIRPALKKVCLATEKGLCSADMYPLTPVSDIYSKFLLFVMLSEWFTQFTILESDRVAMPKINRDALNECYMVVPPLIEQKAIAHFLDQETAKIDTIIEKTKTSIEKLKEYRTALISAAVTGKIDIREEI